MHYIFSQFSQPKNENLTIQFFKDLQGALLGTLLHVIPSLPPHFLSTLCTEAQKRKKKI